MEACFTRFTPLESSKGTLEVRSPRPSQAPRHPLAAAAPPFGPLTFIVFVSPIRGPLRRGVAVGSTRTDALKTILNEDIEQAMVELTPMARLGEVEDIAMGALYLCSPAASYVTGDILGVNGGLERLNMQMPRAWGGMG